MAAGSAISALNHLTNALLIHFLAVADFEDDDFPLGIENMVENSVVADAYAPAWPVSTLKLLATSGTWGGREALKGRIDSPKNIIRKGG
jgi:hypothetical protein